MARYKVRSDIFKIDRPNSSRGHRAERYAWSREGEVEALSADEAEREFHTQVRADAEEQLQGDLCRVVTRVQS